MTLVLLGEPAPLGPGREVAVVHLAIMGARGQGCSGHGHGSTCSRLALVGWWATAGVSRQPDRQGVDRGVVLSYTPAQASMRERAWVFNRR